MKIFQDILDSSVWDEDLATRIVWITMLVMADEEGVVRASVSGVRRRAGINKEEIAQAMKALTGPDLDSKDQSYGGRRVERIDGGWLVLNYKKYREIRTRQQIKDAERQRRHRADRKRDGSRTSQHITTIAYASESKERSKSNTESSSKPKGDGSTSSTLPAVRDSANWINAALATIGPSHFIEDRLLWEGRTVFSFWQWRAKKNGQRVIFSQDRKRRISRWLKTYGLEDCLYAVEGVFHHPDHNQENKEYHEFENIFKSREGAGTVEKLRDAGHRYPKAVKRVLARLSEQGWEPGGNVE